MSTATAPPRTTAPPAGAPDSAPDGRRRRGHASRRAILDAATRLIADTGVAALTHRTVAETAGVPLARVSYHFPTIEDLMVSAATEYLRAFDEHLREMAESARSGRRSLVEACTDLLYELVTDGAAQFLGMVEVRLALARRRRTVEDTGIVAVIGSFGADQQRAGSIAAAMFGFAVLAATEPGSVTRSQVRSHVRTVLEAAA